MAGDCEDVVKKKKKGEGGRGKEYGDRNGHLPWRNVCKSMAILHKRETQKDKLYSAIL